MPGIRPIKIEKIELDADIQPRVETSQSTIEEYAEALTAGTKLPPVTIFRDKEGVNRLADGFTRVNAHIMANLAEINANVKQGTKRDAILFAVGANADHGQRRTNDDKRKAVVKLLSDPEWSTWSDRKIADACQVNHHLVAELRPVPTGNSPSQSRVGKDGKSRPATKSTGRTPSSDTPNAGSKVNGHAAPDPHEVAKSRANGKIPANAVVEITEPDDPTSLADVAEEHGERVAISEDGMSDADWIRSLPLASQLDGPMLREFTGDALAYRRLESARDNYKNIASRLIKGVKGEFVHRVRSFLSTDHPKNWLLCPTTENGGCGGGGSLLELGLQCTKCRGRGYWIAR